MRFSIEQKPFLSAISLASQSAAVKPVAPILSHALIEAQAGKLRITASDGIATTSVEVEADVQAPGALAVPAHALRERVSKLDGKAAAASGKSGGLELKSGTRKFRLESMPAEVYPPRQAASAELVYTTIDAGVARKLLATASYAAAIDRADTPQIECVVLQSDGSTLRAYAIDGARFCVARAPCASVAFAIAMHRQRARDIERALERASGAVKLGFSRCAMSLATAQAEYACALPNVEPFGIDALFARIFEEAKVQVPREALLSSVRALACATDKNKVITLQFSRGTLQLKTEHGEDELPAEYTGQDNKIVLDIAKLDNALSAVEDDEIAFGLTSDDGLGLLFIRPAVGDAWVAGIMPVRP